MKQILSSGNRYLEGGFELLAGMALIPYGVSRGGRFLGVWMLLALRYTFTVNTIARSLGTRFGDELSPKDAPLPPRPPLRLGAFAWNIFGSGWHSLKWQGMCQSIPLQFC